MPCNSLHRPRQAGAAAYSGWDPPLSYSSVAFMNADLGVLDRATGKCVRDGDLYDAVSCPDGYYKRPRDAGAGRCAALGTPCPDENGYTCLCRPCFRAEELEVYMADSGCLSYTHAFLRSAYAPLTLYLSNKKARHQFRRCLAKST